MRQKKHPRSNGPRISAAPLILILEANNKLTGDQLLANERDRGNVERKAARDAVPGASLTNRERGRYLKMMARVSGKP